MIVLGDVLPLILSLLPFVVARPNIIVMQADDLPFFEQWNPPAHHSDADIYSWNLPHINRLRDNGLQMTRAYTASPACGTSRYSTICGRYPTRSAFSRRANLLWGDDDISYVHIPDTKLVDVDSVSDGQDCSANNVAVLFQTNGYATGMFGKWHLNPDTIETYDYERTQNQIRACGFDRAEAVHWDNLMDGWTNGGQFSHNLEYTTKMALNFMEESLNNQGSFFMFFNPTAPHASGNVRDALLFLSCKDTPAGRLFEEPIIPSMTEGVGCDKYRQTILERAGGDESNEILGSIWVDDTVGALLTFLERWGELDNTVFLFQHDHGVEGKFTLYEGGVRITQFLHYPNEITPGSTYDGLVSTIDVAPTLADFAGIDANSFGWYEMDGKSWMSLATNTDRCIVVEYEYDRSVICECRKLTVLPYPTSSQTFDCGSQYGLTNESPLWIDLCDENGTYRTSPDTSPEEKANMDPDVRMDEIMACHQTMTRPFADPVYGMCDEIKRNPASVPAEPFGDETP